MKELIIAFFLLSSLWCSAQEKISSTALQSDAKLMWQTLNELHPGMYRHADTTELAKAFDQLLEEFSIERSQNEAFKYFSEFVVKIKCGHTYLNPLNQSPQIIDSLLDDAVLLPFSFSLIDYTMIVDSSLTEKIRHNDIIKCINDIPVSKIIDSLSHYIKADGNRKSKKIKDLQVLFEARYNYFDYYFPLIYGFKDSVSIELIGGEIHRIPLITKQDRNARISQNTSYDDMWSYSFYEHYAYLKLGTFVTWKMSLDWEAYLDEFFEQLTKKRIQNLIIDIRDNEGGMTEVTDYLTNRLANKSGILIPRRKHLVYKKVSKNLKPHLSTWSKWFYNVSWWTKKLDNRYRTPRFSRIKKKIKRNTKGFQGQTFVLVNEANSSATFILAENLKINKYATLVGTETGGTKKGINGGQIFFLKLPNSNIEIDIPLIGSYPIKDLEDQGIIPDIHIPITIDNHINKYDSQLNYITRMLIKNN